MGARIGDIGEERVIGLFCAPGTPVGAEVVVENGDDAAAYLTQPFEAEVVTTDSLVEGVHFAWAHGPAERVGRKLLAVNLSDIAAMGARPKYALLSVCLPPELLVSVAREVASGIHARCREAGVTVLGGNVTRTSGPAVLGATLIGSARPSSILRRTGARVGDGIFVTGTLGDARAGLFALESDRGGEAALAPLVSALTDPIPRVEMGLWLARTGEVHSVCDVSDGFGRDLVRLLEGSGLGARVEAAALPISPALRAFSPQPESFALAGGEEYELLFTGPFDADFDHGPTPVTRVGEVRTEVGIDVHWPDGRVEALPAGFDHFTPPLPRPAPG